MTYPKQNCTHDITKFYVMVYPYLCNMAEINITITKRPNIRNLNLCSIDTCTDTRTGTEHIKFEKCGAWRASYTYAYTRKRSDI